MKHRVVHYIDSQSFGGTELILFNLISGLDPKRWESILVYHSHPGIAPFIEKVNELDIEIISLPPIKRWTNISQILELTRKLRVVNATVFHAQLPWYLSCSFGLLCAFLARVPAIVATQHLYIEISPNRLYILQKLVSMIVDRYIAVSDGVARKLSRLFFSPNKIRVVKNGISVENFNSTRSNTLRDLLKNNEGMPIVLTVARLDKQKGHEYLLEAASMVPDAVFVLVGDGPEREKLETYVNETSLDNRVVFLRHRQDIREILSGCDLFVLPSLYEGLPLSILEAMAAGRPVIASDINGTDEIIIDGKTGILVPPADPRAIAEAIRRILSDPSLARNLADSGKKRACSEFSSKKMVEGVTRVYDDIIRENRQNERLEADSRPAEEYGHLVLLRADWRFLLPNPNPDKSICFADGMLAKAVEIISNSTLQSDLQPPSSEHDLAVATNPDEKLLNVVFSALKPGGSCYIEWDVHTFFKPEAIGVKLEKAGFEMINFYMPKPDPAKAPSATWIPLESYGAVSFLIKRAYQDKTYSAIKKIGNALRYFLWLLSPRLFINYPWLFSSGQTRFKVCSLARKPVNQSGKEAPFIMEEKLGNIIRGYLNDNGDSERRKLTEILMLTGGSHRFNKVILAAFEEKAYTPTIVVKIPRIVRSAHTLANEVKTLRTIHDEFQLTTGIPQVVFANHDLGYYAVGETFIEGVPLAKILKRNNCRDLALKATSWLLELAKKSEITLPNDWRNTLTKPLIHEFTTHFGHSIDIRLIEQTNDIVCNLEIPCLTCEHRDFSPWNIHVDSKGRLGVLDWESSRLNGIPALDLIYFITYLCFYVEDAWRLSNFKECYKTMLNSDTFTGSIFKECLNHYATTLGIPIKSLYSLRIVAWLTHLVSEFEHSAHDDKQTKQLETARKSLFLELWEEDILLSGEIES